MAGMSRDKGKRGELEFSHFLQSYGYSTRRGQQFAGANGDADVVGLPGFHIEVKRTERLNLYAAVDQARKDSGGLAIPIVVHRCNDYGVKGTCRGDWLVVLGIEDFLRLLPANSTGIDDVL